MQYDVVFEGGGAKGAVFVGAMQELEARGHTARRFVGTSAGAITATLAAAGYTATAMLEALTERLPSGAPVFTSFQDPPAGFTPEEVRASHFAKLLAAIDLPFVPNALEDKIDAALLKQMLEFSVFRQIFSLIEKGGLYEGGAFRRWIRAKLEQRARGLGDATMAEFARQTGTDLTIIASDTDGKTIMVLNQRTAPRCPVAWAVRMSMGIPLIWQEVEWQSAWGTYRGANVTGHRIVDGGVLSNFPIHLVSSSLGEVAEIMGDADPYAVPNIGFLIDETQAVPGVVGLPKTAGWLDQITESKPIRRLQNLIETMMEAHDRAVIESCMSNHEICRLPASGYGVTEFDLSGPRLKAIIAAGRAATKKYFDDREAHEASEAWRSAVTSRGDGSDEPTD